MLLTPLRWLRRSLWTSGLILGLVAAFVWADPVLANELNSPLQSPAQLFEIHCAGCHPNGGNIIRRGKTLKAKALNRYGYTEVSAVADIIANGKGVMSAYRDRLTDETIHTLATYVLEQADAGW
jgi:cytochrome c6